MAAEEAEKYQQDMVVLSIIYAIICTHFTFDYSMHIHADIL